MPLCAACAGWRDDEQRASAPALAACSVRMRVSQIACEPVAATMGTRPFATTFRTEKRHKPVSLLCGQRRGFESSVGRVCRCAIPRRILRFHEPSPRASASRTLAISSKRRRSGGIEPLIRSAAAAWTISQIDGGDRPLSFSGRNRLDASPARTMINTFEKGLHRARQPRLLRCDKTLATRRMCGAAHHGAGIFGQSDNSMDVQGLLNALHQAIDPIRRAAA